ncbi:IS5 family transposase [Aquabacterium sp. CECT 9606]|uniref:IS5 family transposase n=1 Tax=Aquabacterium sp. CECT 9606 TaxID=2845822 RepID=UPI001EF9C596|nr:IS5 family transposase ISXoo5 [Aquabacterium sp. CECT 9606]
MSTPDFFRARLDGMIDLNHPLAVLGRRMPWVEIEKSLAPLFARKARMGRQREDADMFGPMAVVVAGGVSAAGRPRLPIRLMVALLYLKHAFNESDESLVERWAQDVLFQYFSGQEYYEHRLPCDPSQIGRFRRVLGEAGVEQLLKSTIETAVRLQAIKKTELQKLIVDSTVQEKSIAHPTDSRLLDVARDQLAELAKKLGMTPKQTFEREAKQLRRKAGGYAHARQFKRLRSVLRRQRTILGVLMRDVQRKMDTLAQEARKQLQLMLDKAQRIHAQTAAKGNSSGRGKLYALHAPEAECISKGKARKPYEFGVKVSLAITHAKGLIVGARSFPGNPYDGHTLAAQLEQTSTLLQDLDVLPRTAIVDLGYRGVDAEIAPVELIHRGKSKRLTGQQRRWLKRRQAIEPVIGHVKQDHGMQRCWLKGEQGDALHAVLCAAGFNLRWLLRAIARKGLKGFFAPLFFLLSMVVMLFGTFKAAGNHFGVRA